MTKKAPSGQRKNYRHGVQFQVLVVFLCAFLIPVSILCALLIRNEIDVSEKRYQSLVNSETVRVRSAFLDITMTIDQITKPICDNLEYHRFLSAQEFGSAQLTAYNELTGVLRTHMNNMAQIQSIGVFTDNTAVPDGEFIHCVNLSEQDWYSESNASSWWCLSTTAINDQQSEKLLTQVRRIPLGSLDNRAYLVVKLSDDYLRNKLMITNYDIRISFEGETECFFSSSHHYGGVQMPVDENPDIDFTDYQGRLILDGQEVLASIQPLVLYGAGNRISIMTADLEACQTISEDYRYLTTMILISISVPILIIVLFSKKLSRRIMQLRTAMHRASTGDYNLTSTITGDDELSDTFQDLQIMTQNIRKREQDYYATKLRDQELENEQKEMEFKMLASQINPHFLYNTLETIRMQALANRDRATASSIMLLSNSMHYVLENIGTKMVPIQRELDQVERYLKIQQLRFGDRVTWDFYIGDDIDTNHIALLPLMIEPIVENAVNYGVEPKIGRGHVSIILEREGRKLAITVKDNGPGISEERLNQINERIHGKKQAFGKSIGLANISHRIQSLYGNEYGMTIRSREGKGTSVEITVEIRDI